MARTAHVPCNSCVACCDNDLILLHPEQGDWIEDFATVEVVHPLTGQPAHALQQKPTGGCLYLTETGCSIHGHAPVVCRTFDCRQFFLSLSSYERRGLVKNGVCSKAVLKAGRERLHTLNAREKPIYAR